MAVYKVLQDIEAEDKLIGSLTLKQFIFAGIAFVIMFIGYYASQVAGWGALIAALVFASPFIFLAAPIGTDQPNDIWLAGQLRFRFKPKIRKWDQTGQHELVTITAPHTQELVYSDGLSNNEINSRLKALASTIDSRGWAVKNVAIDLANPTADAANNDRLVSPRVTREVPDLDIRPSDDILDSQGTEVGRHFQDLMDSQTVAKREEALKIIEQARQQVSNNPAPQQQAATQTNDNTGQTQADGWSNDVQAAGQQQTTQTQAQPAQAPQATPQVPDAVVVNGDELAINHHANPAIINELALAKDELKVSTLSALAGSAEKREQDVLMDDQIIELH